MTEKTALWDKLGRTDPAHTKTFKRGGGFTGTAIKPMWSYRRMTEQFGPCGEGWGINEPQFNVVNGDNREILVYCTASIWYYSEDGHGPNTVYGVGGDKVVTHIKANEQYKRPERWENDDEAFKKAFTDAITNALKMIGVGADVHMGMFDDSKYVNTIKAEFQEEQQAKAQDEAPAKSSAQLKRDGEWERVSKEIADAMNDIATFGQFEELKASYRKEAGQRGWNKAFLAALKDLFDGYEDQVRKTIEAENAGDVVQDIVRNMGGVVRDERVISTLQAG